MIRPQPRPPRHSRQHSRRLTERKAVTVCIAAIAEKNTLIGVSDRMLTAGDVEFEPGQAKMWAFSSSIWALIAGDMGIQAEIFKRTGMEVHGWINAEPTKWVAVKDVAESYCKHYRELLRTQAEAAILRPLGLDFPSFLAKQSSMQGDLVASVAERLSTYEFSSALETIFIGRDNDGPLNPNGEKLVYCQLYEADGSKLTSLTTVGFAAIGIGKFHAESQFMFSGHWPSKAFHETLLLSYAAKKRAEVAPGVGKDTDMVVIGPGLGTSLKVEDRHIAGLDKIYQKSRRFSARGIESAKKETQAFVEQVRKEYKEKDETKIDAESKQQTSDSDK
jgi:hypothetical protein